VPHPKVDARRHGEERLHVVVEHPGLLESDLAALVGALAKGLELAASKCGERHDEGDAPAGLQIERGGADEEQGGQVGLGGKAPADIDALATHYLAEPRLQVARHVAEGKPGRVTDDDIRLSLVGREIERPAQVARDVGPDRVPPGLPQLVIRLIGVAQLR
jgi:hypothetical protein